MKPAALLYFGVPVVDIKAGSYSCRPRNNQAGAKVSEHAFGNAMDVMGFVFADGRQLMVVKGWRGDPADQEFLREVFVGACRYFTTVLAPGRTRSITITSTLISPATIRAASAISASRSSSSRLASIPSGWPSRRR